MCSIVVTRSRPKLLDVVMLVDVVSLLDCFDGKHCLTAATA